MVVEKILTILNAVKILEVTLSNLYKLCFDKWGNQNDKFWLVLQAQESFHAENVDEMKKIIISYPNDFIENNKFSIQLINSITIYINGIINELINDKLTEKKLLIKARDIENSLIESNYQNIVITKNTEYLKLVDVIVKQTEAHKKMIINKIAS